MKPASPREPHAAPRSSAPGFASEGTGATDGTSVEIKAAPATARTSGSGGSNAGAGVSGSTSGTRVNGGTGVNATGSGAATGGTIATDPNATNSTNGMNDRCKDAAGNDVDNSIASGTTTSPSRNCNK